MKIMPSDDYETPIEEFPGHLGHEMDQMLFFDWLSPQDKALWTEYIDVLVDEDVERIVVVTVGEASHPVRIEPDRWLGPVLDQLPSFEVWQDGGNPDAAPAGGSGYVFCLAERASGSDAGQELVQLLIAIREDLASLRAAGTSGA